MLDLHRTYMRFALDLAKESKAERKKVGAVLVTNNGVLLPGINGTPSGWDNTCEDSYGYDLQGIETTVTKQEVIHAELNCILKAAKEGVSVVESTLYVTLSPCVPCAAMIAQAGIKRVFYYEDYRCKKGIDILRYNAILVHKLEI